MKKKKKNRKQILSLLMYLQTVGIPCKMTLSCIDENYHLVEGKTDIPIDMDDLPMDILYGDENYFLNIQIENITFGMENHDPSHNRKYFEGMKQKITEMSEGYLINWDRKTKLDDILSDPNPPKEVPV